MNTPKLAGFMALWGGTLLFVSNISNVYKWTYEPYEAFRNRQAIKNKATGAMGDY